MNIIVDKQATGVNTPSTQSIMLLVLLALIPGTVAYAVFISPLVIFNIVFAVSAAMMLELLAVRMRGINQPKSIVNGSIRDASIALAATLLALSVPPALPFWQLFIGVLIMVMLGKHVFGGIGHNPFNPAMVGYAALLVSFPQSMTFWFTTTEWASMNIATPQLLSLLKAKASLDVVASTPHIAWDGITQATPLEHARSLRLQSLQQTGAELNQRALASGWIQTSLGFSVGGVFLLYKKVISWHIPFSVLCSFAILSLLFSSNNLSLPWALLSGAMMIGAFFIATDPVTAASSRRAQLVFGAGIGALTFVIREYGGYPEGFAFAVLLMNLSVPLIDHIDLVMVQTSPTQKP